MNKHEFEGKICWTKTYFLENSIPSILIICSEENSMPQLVWKTRNSIFSSNTFKSYCFYDPKRQWQNWYMYNEEKPVIETLRKKITETYRVMERLCCWLKPFSLLTLHIYLLWKTKLLIYREEFNRKTY